MTVRFVRPVSHSAYAARRIGLAALVLFLLAALAHRFGPLTGPDFVALLFLSAAIAAAAVPLALIGLARLWQVGASGGVAAAKALIYAALPLGTVATGAFLYYTQPALHDISTDLSDPPDWVNEPRADQQWMPRSATVTPADRRAQFAAYPGLTGRRYEGALDRVYEGVKNAALSARITITRNEGLELVEPDISERPAPGDDQAVVPDVAPIPLQRPEPLLADPELTAGDLLLQGETRTLVLGLRFDVVIRLREDAETTSVDIRVASRYGPHDLGLGAVIAEDFLDRLDVELLGISGG
ncbi:DUF1499 domain-containing protein [Rhizobium sp. LC145]|jgi:hypothetical protein|uniref:DUF1499 domain-containing protein n=1 Tax=Rhizobium sp. LC145 TaxID=1120688 RepID=UPI00062A2C17|nr:DUF1499 domain-containing protein [Rhizobium sp. LC145]KKX28263.1 hypothetical protein YH62_19475 [Rhizobium sp. LC145]TKT58314.1 DUF1499 domain-containing protein [Rhizobiaceae bacterium LC148]